MRPIKKNKDGDAVVALEAALRIIEAKSLQKAEAGATVWIKPDGSSICVRITADDAAMIKGAVFIGGPCKEVIPKVSVR